MPTVKLLNPSGEPMDVDPDQYDVPAMMRDGFTRAPVPEKDPNMVMVSAHQRWRPGMKMKRKEPMIVSQLPNIGGFAGDLVGRGVGGAAGLASGALTVGTTSIPGAVVGQQVGGTTGAAVGGAAGESVRQMIGAAMGYGEDMSPEDRASAIAGAGATQAAYSVGGQVIGRGAAMVGKALMGGALKVAPEVAQTALREGITATKAGMKVLGARLGEYGQRTTAMLRFATRQGVRFDPTDILQGGAQSLMADLGENQIGTAAERMGVFKELASKFVAQHTRNGAIQEMTPLQLHLFKQQAQKIAEPIYAKIARKEAITPIESATVSFYEAMANFAQQQLERTTPAIIDHATGKALTLAEANMLTSHLIKLKEALAPLTGKAIGVGAEVAKRAAAPAAVGATVGVLRPGNRPMNALEGALLGGVATNPAVMSRVGLMLNNPMLAQLLMQTPRAVGALAEEGR